MIQAWQEDCRLYKQIYQVIRSHLHFPNLISTHPILPWLSCWLFGSICQRNAA